MITKIAKRLDSLEKDIQEIKALLKGKKKAPIKRIAKAIISKTKEPECHEVSRYISEPVCHAGTRRAGHC